MTTDILEDYARRDAALDRLVGEPFWYQRRGQWARGHMSDDEWRRYQAAYAAAQRGAQIAPHLAQA